MHLKNEYNSQWKIDAHVKPIMIPMWMWELVLPYFKNVYYPINNALKPYNIQLISSIKNKFKFLKLGKDQIKKENINVVYKISYLYCNSKYILVKRNAN